MKGVMVMSVSRDGVKGGKGQRRKAFYFFLWSVLFFSLLSSPIRAEEDHWKALEVIRLPDVAPPDFALTSLDGDSITLGDLKGKVALINFWATWCPHCKGQMPSMERIYRKLKDKGFTILAVNIMENLETVKKFARKYDLSFPVLLDRRGEVAAKYGANALPTTIIIDMEGKAVGIVIGPRKWDGEHAKAFFSVLLGD